MYFSPNGKGKDKFVPVLWGVEVHHEFMTSAVDGGDLFNT